MAYKFLLLSMVYLMSFNLSFAQKKQEHITVKGTLFFKGKKPYAYVGANYWYGSLLASKKVGNRKRLLRELDNMKANGINNLRILVGAEGGTYDYTVKPALQYTQGNYDEDLLDALDFLLVEMGKRDMYAVLFLTNNWEWSGGFSQYLEWNGNGAIPNPNIQPNTWAQFMSYTSQFYSCEPCITALENYVTFILSRTNNYSKVKYIQDNTIMAWQVANEPRSFNSENEEKFTKWLDKIIGLIDGLDPYHLISTGSEGLNSSNDDINTFEKTHSNNKIDYLTMHIWPKNWNWYNANKPTETFENTLKNTQVYIDKHVAVAKKLNRPIIIEEFGLSRDGEKLSSTTSVRYRDEFYSFIFKNVLLNVNNNQPLRAANFWGYGGEGKATNESGKWNKGDDLTTDPPQEPQGLNSVFSTDLSTLKIIKLYNKKLRN